MLSVPFQYIDPHASSADLPLPTSNVIQIHPDVVSSRNNKVKRQICPAVGEPVLLRGPSCLPQTDKRAEWPKRGFIPDVIITSWQVNQIRQNPAIDGASHGIHLHVQSVPQRLPRRSCLPHGDHAASLTAGARVSRVQAQDEVPPDREATALSLPVLPGARLSVRRHDLREIRDAIEQEVLCHVPVHGNASRGGDERVGAATGRRLQVRMADGTPNLQAD